MVKWTQNTNLITQHSLYLGNTEMSEINSELVCNVRSSLVNRQSNYFSKSSSYTIKVFVFT